MAIQTDGGVGGIIMSDNLSNLNWTNEKGSFMTWFILPTGATPASCAAAARKNVYGLQFSGNTPPRMVFMVGNGNTNDTIDTIGIFDLSYDTIYHACLTCDLSLGSNQLKGYINGSLIVEGSSTKGTGSDPNNYLGWGGTPATTTAVFNPVEVIVWDTRVYDRPLSAAEINTIYHSQGADNFTEDLLGRWMMDEKEDGQGVSISNDVIDITGGGCNAHKGTSGNAYWRPSNLVHSRAA